jgi:hypothetical protein
MVLVMHFAACDEPVWFPPYPISNGINEEVADKRLADIDNHNGVPEEYMQRVKTPTYPGWYVALSYLTF